MTEASFFVPLSQIRQQPVPWLWPERLGLGKLGSLEGDPGMGKSLVALDLCARLSRGWVFPDGRPGPGPAAALFLSAEDGAGDTLRPRLEALGGDVERIHVYQEERAGKPLRFPTEVEQLECEVVRRQTRLVVIDPITAFLDPNVFTGNDLSVRRALAPLAALAERQQAAILLVRHLTKAGGKKSVYRGGGSIGFIGSCRSAWLIAAEPAGAGSGDPRPALGSGDPRPALADPRPALPAGAGRTDLQIRPTEALDRVACPESQPESRRATPVDGRSPASLTSRPSPLLSPERRVLAQVKNNLAPPQPSLVFRLVPQADGPPLLAWEGASGLAADQLLAGGTRALLPARARLQAAEAIEALLRDGPRSSRDVWELAQELGLSFRTLERAKGDLGIRSKRVWADGQRLSYWLLEGQDLPADAAPKEDDCDLEPWFKPLREKYPPPTPIDDL
jgi:hypothetical protein